MLQAERSTDPTFPTPHKSYLHGIKFLIPPGWSVQEPPFSEINPEKPAIIVLGPVFDSFPDSLTVTIKETKGKTFEQLQTEKINTLQPQIDNGSLDLKYTGVSEVSGRDTYSIYAQGLFIKNSPDEFTPEETVSILFAEVMIYDTPKYYTISISSDRLDQFDQQIENLEKAVYSFTILDDKQTSIAAEEGGGCLIATAAFGSEMAPQVQFLRELRDNTVLQTHSGTAFMTGFNQFYYSFSPVIADYERENPAFKETVKLALTPLLISLTLLQYADIDSESEMLGYGIGIILLNIGMYFVAPAVLIMKIRTSYNKIPKNI